MDDQQQADDQRRRPHRARARADLHHRRRHPGVRHRVQLRRQAGAARRLRLRHQGRRPAGRCSVRGASSTTSSSSNCRAARSAATSGSSTTTRSTPSTGRTCVDSANCPPACPGTLIRGPIDFRHPSFGSDAIDPDLKPMRQQEATVGLDHQLNDVMAVSVRYVHKQVDRAIEDTGSLDADGNEIYVIANPGEGLTALAFTNPNVGAAEGRCATTTASSSRSRSASRNNWYLRTQLPVEPPVWQLLGPVAVGRKRPHQPERRPPVRLPADDVPGRRRRRRSARWRPIVRTSSRRSSSTSSASARASA